MPNLFPCLATDEGQQSFLKWLAITLQWIDDEATPTIRVTDRKYIAQPGIGALLAGAHRFMLDIYPVYLVSVLAGKFRPTRIVEETREHKETRVMNVEFQCPASKEELSVRSKLRNAIKKHLFSGKSEVSIYRLDDGIRQRRRRNSYPVDKKSSESLQRSWSQVKIKTPQEFPTEGKTEGGRKWNLALSISSLERMLAKNQVKSANTLKNLFESSCSVLDALDGQPVWALTKPDVDNLLFRVTQSFLPKVLPHLRRILYEAARIPTQSGADPMMRAEMLSVMEHDKLKRLVSHADKNLPHALSSEHALRMTGSRPRDVPTAEQCERITRMMRKELKASTGVRRQMLRDARVYTALLALGLRKAEAATVVVGDVDWLDHARLPSMTDLYVHEGKTPAAERIVPLDTHPHKKCAQIIVDQARLLYRKTENREAQLINTSGNSIRDYEQYESFNDVASRRKGSRQSRKRKRERYGRKRSLAILDRELKKFGTRCGKENLTRHALRHASVTSSLAAPNAVPELIAKAHGHADLPTSFQNYAHGLSQIQALELSTFLRRDENRVWIAVTDAAELIGSPRQTVYEAFKGDDENIGDHEAEKLRGSVVGRKGRRQRVDAAALVAYYLIKRGRLENKTPKIK